MNQLKAGSPFLCSKAILRSIIPMTDDNTLFEFTVEDEALRTCLPGQFVQLWVPGVGECPISVCSGRVGDTIQLTIRKAGRVTGALFGMEEGSWLGLRGPFGHGFPVEHFLGKDLCLVAGGLGAAPIRSLWQYMIDRRESFGKLILIYGMRHSKHLLFRQEFQQLLRRKDIQVYLAAEDVAGPYLPPLEFQLGRVTDMIALAEIDEDFQVALCGPPVMYKYAVDGFRMKKVPDSNMWLSLERHMKCGIGKCGHCFVGGKFTCKEGPVFQLSELNTIPEVIECGSPRCHYD